MTRVWARLAWRGVARRPLQSLLMTVAMSFALAGALTSMAVIAGIREQTRRDLERVGMDVVNVHVAPSLDALFASPLLPADVARVREAARGPVAPARIRLSLAQGSAAAAATILELATTPEWGTAVPLEFRAGRFFTAAEADACVLDEWVASQLFPGRPALGETVVLGVGAGRRPYRVCGVMSDPFEIRKRFDELDAGGSARARILRLMEFKSVYVPLLPADLAAGMHAIVARTGDGVDPLALEEELRGHFQARGNQVWVWARARWVENILTVADFAMLVGDTLWMIGLLITGVMLFAVTMIGVRARFREIAIRRTEGARRWQVALQLLAENALLGAAAGACALTLAWVGGRLLSSTILSWGVAFRAGDIALALGMGTLLSTLATALPAWRAASLDPVEVLRS